MRVNGGWRLVLLLVVAVALVAGCGDDDRSQSAGSASFNPFAGYSSPVYSKDSMWLCRPGLPHDYCFDNIDATEVLPDDSLEVVHRSPAADPSFDCFYVYPTVNLSAAPGNDTDFSDVRLKLDPLLSQAAPFTRLCRLFAPLYRQVTIGTLMGAPNAQPFIDIAYGDVLDAFKQYMGQYNNGRPFVLMGHSQGSIMLTRLMQEELDNSPLRERLIVALLIGDAGLYVPRGQVVGGTFQDIPLCVRDTETGCVIGYNSFAEDSPPPADGGIAGGLPAGMETACTNPGALGGGKMRYTGSYFPNFSYQVLFRLNIGPPGIETPFTLYRDYFTGECITREDGVRYLQIGSQPEPDDQRQPASIRNALLESLGLGLHLLDYNLPQDDLIALVQKQAQAMASRP
jgi:Protein of unknown function (DUF3089)